MKIAFFSLLGIVLFGFGYLMVNPGGDSSGFGQFEDTSSKVATAEATVRDGSQEIDITARGGYSPKNIQAKANMPLTIHMKTKGTFDCSSSVLIPALNYSGYLPATGTVDIPVPPQTAGTTMRGMCSMGMYHFSITFS